MTTATQTTIDMMYWLPYCSTCVKAEQFLLDKGVKIKRFVNLKEERLSRAEVEKLVRLIGGAEKLFSKRAMKYRSMGLDKMTLTEEDMIRYMTEEYTFIKRPVIVLSDQRILAGFSAKQYLQLLTK